MKEVILGIDIGTSSCKTLLLDANGGVVGASSASYGISIPAPGYSEQNPNDWLEATRKAIFDIKSKHDDVKIIAIGVSGQMHGLTTLDKSGSDVRPAILWNDQRNGQECIDIIEKAGGEDRLLSMTGNLMLPGYTGGKIFWMMKNERDLFNETCHILNPKDYLRLKLTGEYATEVSDASGTGLFDVCKRQWSDELLDLLEIDKKLLPFCHESNEITGKVTNGAAEYFGLEAGIPVIGGGGDSVIQTVGSGLIDSGELQTTIGTAGILATSLDRPIPNHGGRLQVFCNIDPNKWHCMGVSLNAGGALSWLKQIVHNFCNMSKSGWHDIPFSTLSQYAETSTIGSNGLIFLPYLNGERCPYADPYARGGWVGMTWLHKSTDMIRSLMEGVVYALYDMYFLMQKNNIQATRIRASGGGASSLFWRQIQADIFNCEVVTTEGAAEGGAYGAAIVAGVGIGMFASTQEAAAKCRIVDSIQPNLNSHELYQELFSVYHELYPSLKDSFHKLSNFSRINSKDKK